MNTNDQIRKCSKKWETLIWRSIKKGDTLALGELYDVFIDSLFSYGVQHSNNRDYVMDCIHDLFLDLHKYASKLGDTDNVEYYLQKSLKRKINKKYQSKIIPLQTDELSSSLFFQKRSTDSIEKEIIRTDQVTEINSKLTKALNTLTSKQKEVLFLRYNQNRPYEEIAEIMNTSVASARTSIYRAIKILREHPLYVLLFVIIILFL